MTYGRLKKLFSEIEKVEGVSDVTPLEVCGPNEARLVITGFRTQSATASPVGVVLVTREIG